MQYLSGFFRIIKRGGSASVRPARVLRGGFAHALPQPVKTGADRFQPVCGVKVVPFWNICGQCSKIERPALPGPTQACAGMAPRPQNAGSVSSRTGDLRAGAAVGGSAPLRVSAPPLCSGCAPPPPGDPLPPGQSALPRWRARSFAAAFLPAFPDFRVYRRTGSCRRCVKAAAACSVAMALHGQRSVNPPHRRRGCWRRAGTARAPAGRTPRATRSTAHRQSTG